MNKDEKELLVDEFVWSIERLVDEKVSAALDNEPERDHSGQISSAVGDVRRLTSRIVYGI